jgi:hypothetical protein
MRSLTTLAACAAVAAPMMATAQSNILIFNMRASNTVGWWETTRSNFVGDLGLLVAETGFTTFAMDIANNGTDAYAIEYTAGAGFPIHHIDPLTGARTNTGLTVTGPNPADNCAGLHFHPDGTAYGMFIDATGNCVLWTIDLTTGVATQVGQMIAASLLIDFTIDSQGNGWAHNITDDNFYSVNLATGAATLIGPTGHAANFAQGMDADWSDDAVLATVYTGGGTGKFVQFDTTTGAGVVIADTNSTLMEMEMSVFPPANEGPLCMEAGDWTNNSTETGTVADTCDSDDVRTAARRGTFTPAATALLRYDASTTYSGLGGVTSITVSAECSISNAGVTNVTGRLQIKNQTNGVFATVGSSLLSATDAVISGSPTGDPNQYIGANGEVEVRLVFQQTSGGPNWDGRIDQLTVDIQ